MSELRSCVLKLDWCSFDAAKYAVENWHYSKVMPAGKLVKIGVWEDKEFIGCVLYGRGANNNLAKMFQMEQTECVELVRIALKSHKTPVSKILSISLKLLKKQSPGLKLIVSYADEKQSHIGKVYQASNWVYSGYSIATSAIDPEDGKTKHTRSLHSKYGSIVGFQKVKDKPKHRYLMPLDGLTRDIIVKYKKEYPKALVA